MNTHNDYQNRLPEHQEPLRIAEHDSAYGAVPPPVNSSLAAGRHGRHAGAWWLWGFLTLLAVAVMIGSVYWFSGHGRDISGDNIRNKLAMYTSIRQARTCPQTAAPDKYSANITDSASGSTAAEATESSAVNAQPTGEVIEDVAYLFPLNGSEIADNAELNELASRVAESGEYVTVTAYTDESGRQAYNQKLSQERANKVGNYLVAHGVPADHVKTVGMGPTHDYPIPALDRRAVVHVTHS